MEAVKNTVQVNRGSFELFGFDFLVDINLKVWLIEVNTNPCLEESCKILTIYLHRMINDALKLTVDLTFPPRRGMGPYNMQEINMFKMEGYPDDANLWDLLMTYGEKPQAQVV